MIYRESHISDFVRSQRLMAGLSQDQVGRLVGKTQRQISDIENGALPTPDVLCRIFYALEAWEHVDLIHYMYNLHPLAGSPVDPRLDQSLASALINMMKQLQDFTNRYGHLAILQLERRPDREIDMNDYLDDWKQVYDIYRGIQTVFYAATRDIGLDMREVVDVWTDEEMQDGVTMPRLEKEAVAI